MEKIKAIRQFVVFHIGENFTQKELSKRFDIPFPTIKQIPVADGDPHKTARISSFWAIDNDKRCDRKQKMKAKLALLNQEC